MIDFYINWYTLAYAIAYLEMIVKSYSYRYRDYRPGSITGYYFDDFGQLEQRGKHRRRRKDSG